MMLKRISAFCAACGLTLAIACAATPAYATGSEELQAKLDEANAVLSSLYEQAEVASEAVNQTKVQIETLEAEIAAKQTELSSAQDTLADRVNSNYKTGGVSLITIIFDSSNFEDLVSRIFYANKVSASDAEVIQNVKDIKAQLSTKQAETEQLLSEQEAEQAELDAAAAEAENYVNSLDAELQEALAAEKAAAEAAAAAEAEAAAKAAAEAAAAEEANNATNENTDSGDTSNTNAGGNTESNTNSGNNNTGNNDSDDDDSDNGNNNSGSDSSDYSGGSGSLTAAQRQTIVNAAYSKLGSAYVWGAAGPNSFDCSGFTQWCYAQVGIYISHYSGDQGSLPSTSNPQPGDICYRPGHVGLYIGNGMMIDAANPSIGVRKTSVTSAYSFHYYA